MKFTVYRNEWLRGTGRGSLYSAGLRCCLGFLGNACDISDREMDHHGSPQDVGGGRWPASIRREMGWDSDLTNQIVDVNDGVNATEQQREAKLTELFAQGGIEVEFKDMRGP